MTVYDDAVAAIGQALVFGAVIAGLVVTTVALYVLFHVTGNAITGWWQRRNDRIDASIQAALDDRSEYAHHIRVANNRRDEQP